MLPKAFLLAPCAFAVARGDARSYIRSDANDAFFYDDSGRVRIFHGVNGVQKGFPWYPYWLFNTTLVDEIASLGVNVMRLGWMFTGFAPAQGQFNYTYANEMKKIVGILADRGIYALLDTHQDCLSSEFCLYDGFPKWSLDKRQAPKKAYPWPYTENCTQRGWMTNCLTEAADSCYQDIYDNHNGMRDDLALFWEESAAFWADSPSVLGFELMNEPFAGNIYKDPMLLVPGEAGSKNLEPFYEALQGGIREHDQKHIIFYEPVTWGMIFEGKYTGSGFTQVPGGDLYRNRSALSYHYYCSSFGGNRELCDKAIGPSVFKSISEDVARIGGGSMMTEFGECTSTGQIDECAAVMALADTHFQSWSEWSGFGQSQSDAPPAYADLLSRSYAKAISGKPLNMTYDHKTKEFNLCYELDSSISAPTEVFAQFALHYPTSSTVMTSTANVKITVDREHNSISILPANAAGTDETSTACLNIRAH